MRIKSIRLKNYKRFTDLSICDIPQNSRLVVLLGPNGSGKSSVFDSFLLKVQAAKNNYNLHGEREGYYEKVPSSSYTQEVANQVKAEFYGVDQSNVDWPATFNIRSPYRSEADFTVNALQAVKSTREVPRFMRIIDKDESVSENYRRLAWKRMSDLDRDAPSKQTFGKYRRESLRDLQDAMKRLFAQPTLLLQDFGGIQHGGTFRFNKGGVEDFHYKNLSGGEKAVFDLLLDIFVKRNEYKDAIYCIDEPEAHVATAIQGPLLEVILELIPEKSQLWIATHSIGFVRQAFQMMQNKNNVVFLDFSNHDFDEPVTLRPCVPNRVFWKSTYNVALADLSTLIAPKQVFLCEGNKSKATKGFDANCYNQLFENDHPETLFISQGAASEVVNSQDLINLIVSISSGIEVRRLIDRDDMTDQRRADLISQGLRVLRRREIEEYLYDEKVLSTFLSENNCSEKEPEILADRKNLLENVDGIPNSKHVSRQLFQSIKKHTQLRNLGNKREEFALQYLIPALRNTPSVYQELLEDIFSISS